MIGIYTEAFALVTEDTDIEVAMSEAVERDEPVYLFDADGYWCITPDGRCEPQEAPSDLGDSYDYGYDLPAFAELREFC